MEPHTDLNNLDLLVIAIVLLSGVLALARGFIREMFSLASWSGAYFAAAKLYPLAEPWVHRYIKNPIAVTAVAAAAIFLVTLVILTLVSSLLAGMIRGRALTSIDRSLGFLFGLMRGGLVVCLMYLGAMSALWPDSVKPSKPEAAQEQQAASPDQIKDKEVKRAMPEWLMQARTRPAMAYGADVLKDFIPREEAEKMVHKYSEQYKEQRAAQQHEAEQKALDAMSTPAIAGSKDATVPSYSETTRTGLDQMVKERGPQ